MKKRLRKKLGVGEFTELGFEFYATVADADDQSTLDAFCDLIDECEFYCEGTWDDDGADLFISTGLIDMENEERKAKFAEKVANIAGLSNIKISELI